MFDRLAPEIATQIAQMPESGDLFWIVRVQLADGRAYRNVHIDYKWRCGNEGTQLFRLRDVIAVKWDGLCVQRGMTRPDPVDDIHAESLNEYYWGYYFDAASGVWKLLTPEWMRTSRSPGFGAVFSRTLIQRDLLLHEHSECVDALRACGANDAAADLAAALNSNLDATAHSEFHRDLSATLARVLAANAGLSASLRSRLRSLLDWIGRWREPPGLPGTRWDPPAN